MARRTGKNPSTDAHGSITRVIQRSNSNVIPSRELTERGQTLFAEICGDLSFEELDLFSTRNNVTGLVESIERYELAVCEYQAEGITVEGYRG